MGNNKLWAAFLTSMILIMCSCDPCRELSHKICDCKQNPSERDACRESLKLSSSYDSFDLQDKNSEQCVEAIKNCSCEQINAGELSQCSFSRQ